MEKNCGKQKICYIVGAGENTGCDFCVADGDCVIAVDGGLQYLQEAGITPDFIIGDFDSLGYCPSGENVLQLNVEKDDTDTLAAVKVGMEKGFDVFKFYCCMGGRIAHTLANLQTLVYLSQNGKQGFLFDRDSVLTTITNDSVKFGAEYRGYISVFSYSDECFGVNERGLKYGLTDAHLTSTFPVGVSNEFVGTESEIEVETGTLVIVYPRD